MRWRAIGLLCLLGLGVAPAGRSETTDMVDLSKAVVVAPPALSGPGRKAVDLLIDDVARRSGVRWKLATKWPDEPMPVIAVGSVSDVARFAGPLSRSLSDGDFTKKAEGYRIHVDVRRPAVLVAGNDARGVLFGVGRLLRELRTTEGKVLLPAASRSRPPRGIRSAAISSATGPRPTPTTAGTCPSGSGTSATWRSSAPTPSS